MWSKIVKYLLPSTHIYDYGLNIKWCSANPSVLAVAEGTRILTQEFLSILRNICFEITKKSSAKPIDYFLCRIEKNDCNLKL